MISVSGTPTSATFEVVFILLTTSAGFETVVSMTSKHRERDIRTGQYVHENQWERPCVCGHTLGVHAAVGHNGKPCFNGDRYVEGATGEDCGCMRFRPSKKKR